MKATQEELKMIADYRPTEGVDEGTHIYMSDDEIIDFAKQYHTEQLRLCGVSNSALLEELRLKLIGMECFADEYYNEDAKAGCKTIFDELKDWIDKKRA